MELKLVKQLEKIKSKVSSLKRKLGPLRAIEPKSGHHLDKNVLIKEKNKAQFTKQQRSIENSAKPIAEEMCPIPSPKNMSNTPA